MKLGSIFDVVKPKTTVKNLFEYDANGINFVSSGEKNNGVVDKVKENKEYPIYPPGVITVPLKGTVLHANLQQDYFYCAHQIAILSPKKSLKTWMIDKNFSMLWQFVKTNISLTTIDRLTERLKILCYPILHISQNGFTTVVI